MTAITTPGRLQFLRTWVPRKPCRRPRGGPSRAKTAVAALSNDITWHVADVVLGLKHLWLRSAMT
jgi:hypothetical protein